MDKILRVNLSELKVSTEPVLPEYHTLGGRALTSRIISDEVKANCEPLGGLNKVVLAPGLLAGTTAPSSGRLSVGAKSPLTGTIKESNVGGTAAQALAKFGLKAVVIEGQASEGWYILRIGLDSTGLVRFDELAGKDNYAVAVELRQRYGVKNTVISIGLAGERLYANSTIGVTDVEGNPSRHAGRGGLGAVLGSKRIKAIVIENSSISSFRPSEAFTQGARQLAEAITSNPVSGGALTAFGTAILVNTVNGAGGLPTRNFSDGRFEGVNQISGEKLAETVTNRGGKCGHPCQLGCVIKCSNIYVDQSGNYITSGLEYETLALLGSNCGIEDLDAIARMDRLCDQFGLDTIETGGAIAVAMEGGYLKFGDAQGAIDLVDEMGRGTPMGRLLGQGVQATGRALGVTRIPVVKGQGLAAYDPRAIKGNGVVYATSPMGADHTCGNAMGHPGVDPLKPEGQVDLSRDLQIFCTALDATGLCLFTIFALGGNPNLINIVAILINEIYGTSWNAEDLMGLGVATIAVEKEFNRQAGWTSAADRLPEFFTTETLPSTQTVFDVAEDDMQTIFKA
ncbi:MAG: aldehyde ferredoxin oxidoreductase [Clostridia bacterium]|nr:aldehyde ferredoxin oxidoreductase [Clostridia bacterium]